MSAEDYYLSALLTGVETILSGGTTVLDHVWLDPGKLSNGRGRGRGRGMGRGRGEGG